ncbi:TetR/AcrR family transcriptional regulator [Streptomyces sp. ICBB 8177]|uniref:TetR/AcrR family transcriptional regulator n=1 Tax=Streptomyces sp. ICBB 8177 TaxID=563922 RepID=UPI000D68141A|nr:TetR/AcrR family transcriptional regulator [Streptomyces sp. ICBB 8177]PWI42524.1 TetR family transcriptional regulator [Streptomyces sp. ICBB 8177]
MERGAAAVTGRPAGRAEVGLRDRKKQETRDRLAHVATLMFIERGFEAVTIAEIAEAADVSKMTVTNYFPLKEDLVFDAFEGVVDSLARVVRERRPGEPVLHALRHAFLTSLDEPHPLNGRCTPGFARLVHDSPRLRAREREIDEQREEALAAALTEATGSSPDDPVPGLNAAQLAAVHRFLVRRVRKTIRDGLREEEVRDRAERLARTAFDALEPVLGTYCPGPAA